MKDESIYDIEAMHIASFFPKHRKPSEIKAELTVCNEKGKTLKLKLELAEAELHFFCLANMFQHRGNDYLDRYLKPKRELDQKRIHAKYELNKYQTEKELKR